MLEVRAGGPQGHCLPKCIKLEGPAQLLVQQRLERPDEVDGQVAGPETSPRGEFGFSLERQQPSGQQAAAASSSPSGSLPNGGEGGLCNTTLGSVSVITRERPVGTQGSAGGHSAQQDLQASAAPAEGLVRSALGGSQEAQLQHRSQPTQAAPPNGLGGGPPGGCTWEALSSGTTLVGCPAGGVMTHPAQQLEEPGDDSTQPDTPPASFDWDRAVYSTPQSEPQQGCGEGAQRSGGGEEPPAELLSA